MARVCALAGRTAGSPRQGGYAARRPARLSCPPRPGRAKQGSAGRSSTSETDLPVQAAPEPGGCESPGAPHGRGAEAGTSAHREGRAGRQKPRRTEEEEGLQPSRVFPRHGSPLAPTRDTKGDGGPRGYRVRIALYHTEAMR